MKNLLIILPLMPFLFFLQGCRKHVYQTYFGEIDIDTIQEISLDEDGKLCYRITVVGEDTIYFKPYDKTYYKIFPTNDEHGNCIVQWNPYTGMCTSNW